MNDPFAECRTEEEVDAKIQELENNGNYALHAGEAWSRKLQIRSRDVLGRKRQGDELPADVEWIKTQYEVQHVRTFNIPRFETQARDHMIVIREELFTRDITLEESLHRLYHVMDGILHTLLDHLPENTYARVVITSPDFNINEEDVPISISMQKKEFITPELIFEHIAKIVQSKKRFVMENDFNVHVIHTILPAGQGRKKNCIQLRDKRSVLDVCDGADSLCLARSIVLGQTLLESGNRAASDLNKRKPSLTKLAEQLHIEAGIQIRARAYSLADAEKFQMHLKYQYQLIIISSTVFNKVVYIGTPDTEKKIYIYHHEDHYDLITDIDKFYTEKLELCTGCWALHTRKYPHYECKGICKLCMHKGCTSRTQQHPKWTLCADCNRYFPNMACRANHKLISECNRKKTSSCDAFKKCTDCCKVVSACDIDKVKHHCGLIYCNVCRKHCLLSHKCYVQTMLDPEVGEVEEVGVSLKKKREKSHVYYFDFETDCSTGTHIPVMLAVSDEKGEYKEHFWGKDCAIKFCDKIFSKQFKNAIFLSHNGGRFDNYFILDRIFNAGLTPNVIYNGGTIMYIHVPTFAITFKDTYLYLARPLAALPKMFGLNDIAKTFFPYLLPFEQYEKYVGDYPEMKYYGADNMKEAKRSDCVKWLEKQKTTQCVTPFRYKEHMIEYCENDVEVLRACGQEFRRLFLEKGHVDPFTEAMTLSQAASYVYRRMHMPADSIAIIPPWGYSMTKPCSKKSIIWLEHIAHTSGAVIAHARNGGEYKIKEGFYVDGYIRPNDVHLKGEILEFCGCWYHGCMSCHSRETFNSQLGMSMDELYEVYTNRKVVMIEAGYKYTEIWEHEFDTQMSTDSALKSTAERLDLQEPLKPNQCLYGGRTEPFNLYKQPNEGKGEIIRYLDVNSLYPYTQRAHIFPKGHPEILIAPKCEDFRKWFGLIKAKITPPKKLWLPVLPLKGKGKLLFSLCYTCSMSDEKGECRHPYEKRGWVGSYTTVEVAAALDRGYILDKVYEVWHWSEEKQTQDLFANYVNSFLKLKLAGSGFPRTNMSPEEKIEYALKLNQKENIQISVDEIQDNPGLRSLAKQVLNGLWGKFCQSLSKEKTVYITKPAEYFGLILDETCELTHVRRVNDTIIEVSYKTPEERGQPHPFVNHAIASFVTSYARLVLYNFIEPLGKNLLYCDTDSCVFLTGPGLPDIKEGPCLGEMSCEIFSSHKVEDSIKTWVSVGPKSYAYQLKVNSHIQVVKCKGITLNYTTSNDVNMKFLVDLVTQDECRHERCNVVYPNQMKRDKKKLKIMTKCIKKSFGFTFDKRLIIPGTYDTLPIGYIAGNM